MQCTRMTSQPARLVAPSTRLIGAAPSLAAPLTARKTRAPRGPARVAVKAYKELSESRDSTPVPESDVEFLLRCTKVTVFSSKQYVKDFMGEPMDDVFPNTTYVDHALDVHSASLAEGSYAVCLFVNDNCDADVVDELADCGVKLIALRCAGFDRVDLHQCERQGITVVRVPTYSPESVAEHALALMMALMRNLTTAHNRCQLGNYALSGLVGHQVFGKTAGVLGTGAIGSHMCKMLLGMGCRVIAFDLYPRDDLKELGVEYVEMDTILGESDIISLHCPLNKHTQHLIDKDSLAKMKDGAVLINASRGGLVDTEDAMAALYDGSLAGLAMDVYEGEDKLFFNDRSEMGMKQRIAQWDRKFAQLKTFPNVIITPHTAFLTEEALQEIANTTVSNIRAARLGQPLVNEVKFQG